MSGKSARNRAAAAASAAAVRKARRWHVVAGATGILAGLLLAAGAVAPILQVPGDVPEPGIVGVRVALLAAVILIPIGALLMFSELGAAVRPAAGIYWVAAIMAASPVLQALVLASDLPGVRPGLGAVATILGVVVTGVFGVLLAVAGSAERDDVDTSADRSTSTPTLAAGAVGVIASVVGLGLPLYRSDVSSAASFGDFPWGLDAWGQALFGAALIVGVIVAARSRPPRAVALFLGSALGTVVYVAGWPLAGEYAGSTSIGLGVVPAVVGGLAFLAAALSATRTRE